MWLCAFSPFQKPNVSKLNFNQSNKLVLADCRQWLTVCISQKTKRKKSSFLLIYSQYRMTATYHKTLVNAMLFSTDFISIIRPTAVKNSNTVDVVEMRTDSIQLRNVKNIVLQLQAHNHINNGLKVYILNLSKLIFNLNLF